MSKRVWIATRKRKPPLNTPVLGVRLCRFANADWQWEQPSVVVRTRHGYGNYSEPEWWSVIELPDLPDCPARRAARANYKKNRRIDILIQKLEAQRG